MDFFILTKSIVLGKRVEIKHSMLKEETSEDSTSVSFHLGDPDPGDEFVVDIFVDNRYGTFLFETVGGISRCPHEPNTLPGEDPKLTLLRTPSAYVDPDSTMLFEIELENLGQGTGIFQLEAEQGKGSLSVTIDGNLVISEFGQSYAVKKNSSKRKIIAIQRGPLAYKYEGVTIFLKTCDSPREGASDVRKITLYNQVDNNQEKNIVFLQPCPTISWAGDLRRDKRFALVNGSSDSLRVDIYNNERIKGSLKSFTEDRRLNAVNLKYRRLGDVKWTDAYTTIDGINSPLDFVNVANAYEDVFGYLSLDWNTARISDGTYEIVVESQCERVSKYSVNH